MIASDSSVAISAILPILEDCAIGDGMKRYGVKTKGRVVWVLADDVKVDGEMLLFYRKPAPDSASDHSDLVAGFTIAAIDHFGRPDAFAKDPAAESTSPQSGQS